MTTPHRHERLRKKALQAAQIAEPRPPLLLWIALALLDIGAWLCIYHGVRALLASP